jgi:hypothetical protein
MTCLASDWTAVRLKGTVSPHRSVGEKDMILTSFLTSWRKTWSWPVFSPPFQELAGQPRIIEDWGDIHDWLLVTSGQARGIEMIFSLGSLDTGFLSSESSIVRPLLTLFQTFTVISKVVDFSCSSNLSTWQVDWSRKSVHHQRGKSVY